MNSADQRQAGARGRAVTGPGAATPGSPAAGPAPAGGPTGLGRLRLAALLALCALLGACSTLVQAPARAASDQPAPTLAQAEQGYARVLLRHVNARGEVDFAGLRDDPLDSGLLALEHYVRAIADTALDAAPSAPARLAHMINAYNALSMYNVIASGIPRSHQGWAKVEFFVARKFVIGGSALSLYAFENDIIRKLGEPRVHFALNCSARSCPVLPRQPFSAQALEQELEREARDFFARADSLRIDDARRTVYLSEMLKFYLADFVPAHAPGLIAYVQRYTSQPIPPDYAVAFIAYDWTIANSRAAP